MPISISITGSGRRPTTLVFDQPEIHIGRAPFNDVVLDGPDDGGVSRVHAVIRRKDEEAWAIEDQQSKQGTRVDHLVIQKEHELSPGTEITLGLNGPHLTLVWRRSDLSQTKWHQLLSGSVTGVFPLALYGEFPRRFHLYQKIGEGGHGEVWRARKSPEDPWVAIKYLRPEFLQAESATAKVRISDLVRRFRREADLTRRLSESGVKGIVAVSEIAGNPVERFLYIIMDYVDGRSLDSLTRRYKELDEGLVCRALRRVAKILDRAHKFSWVDQDTQRQMKGIIHRDIKPGNIIISKADEETYLVDFGIAAIQEGGKRLTIPTQRVMNLQYAAPEVLESNAVVPSADLWGLAVTAYVALSGGNFPYEGSRLDELVRATREHDLTPLTAHRRDLDPGLVELIHRCLDPNPRKRLQTARDWLLALEPFLESHWDSEGF